MENRRSKGKEHKTSSARVRGDNKKFVNSKKTNVFITGGAGFVGKHLCGELLSENLGVFATDINLNAVPLTVNKVNIGKIDDKTDFSNVFDNNKIEAIVHLAARVHVMKENQENPSEIYNKINTLGTVNLVKQAKKAGVKKFIFISTIKVNGEKTLKNKPFKQSDKPNPTDDYSISKYNAEKQIIEICKDCEMDYVIIRPPLMYGNGVKGNFISLINLIKTNLPLPFGLINKNKRSLLYVKNLCSAIGKIISNPEIKNEIFLLADDKALSTKELAKGIKKAVNSHSILLPVPVFVLKILGKLLNKKAVIDRLTENLEIDDSYTRQKLDWKAPYDFNEAIRETIER